jgi:hypothetical protein
MLYYLWQLLLGQNLCVTCHNYSAARESLCLYCEIKAAIVRRGA